MKTFRPDPLIDAQRLQIHKDFEAAFEKARKTPKDSPKRAALDKEVMRIGKLSAEFISRHKAYYLDKRRAFWAHLEEHTEETQESPTRK